MHRIGTDIVEIGRIEGAISRWGAVFLRRVFTPAELSLCRGRASSLAVRFAGKEAVMKALGQPAEGISWREIEILADPSGQPVVHLHGKARGQAVDLRLGKLAISLSHSRDYAIAMVIGEPEQPDTL